MPTLNNVGRAVHRKTYQIYSRAQITENTPLQNKHKIQIASFHSAEHCKNKQKRQLAT